MTGLKLVNESGLRKLLSGKRHNVKVSACFFKEMEKKVYMIIEKAVSRAKDNQRNTAMGKDI